MAENAPTPVPASEGNPKRRREKSPLLRVGIHNWIAIIGVVFGACGFVYQKADEIKSKSEELKTSVLRGHDKMESMSATMERVEKNLHSRLDLQDGRLGRVESRMDGHEGRISRLEVKDNDAWRRDRSKSD